jgi:hypothetical protein
VKNDYQYYLDNTVVLALLFNKKMDLGPWTSKPLYTSVMTELQCLNFFNRSWLSGDLEAESAQERMRFLHEALAGMHRVEISTNLLKEASYLRSPEADADTALHWATFKLLREEVGSSLVLFSYDRSFLDAARQEGWLCFQDLEKDEK